MYFYNYVLGVVLLCIFMILLIFTHYQFETLFGFKLSFRNEIILSVALIIVPAMIGKFIEGPDGQSS